MDQHGVTAVTVPESTHVWSAARTYRSSQVELNVPLFIPYAFLTPVSKV